MGDESLETLKGFSRTFVVHSNENPYAAAAAMAQMLARSREAGSYFRPSDAFVPSNLVCSSEEINNDSSPDQVDADFNGDWTAYLRITGLPACGLNYKDSRSPEQNTMRFLNAYCRRIPAMKARDVYESRELSIPSIYRPEFEYIVALLRDGGDLKPYLSRDILKRKRADRNDGLLNSWGIQHLHFRPDGTDHLLFCIISEVDVFLIQVLPHNQDHLWVNTQLLQIVHDNWPSRIARARLNGSRPEEMSATRRASLRGYNANFLVTVSDGTVYLPVAGGTMASGESQEDRVNCDKIFRELEHWRIIISQHAAAIRKALDMPPSKKLVVRMAFENQTCCFYEATSGTRLGVLASD